MSDESERACHMIYLYITADQGHILLDLAFWAYRHSQNGTSKRAKVLGGLLRMHRLA